MKLPRFKLLNNRGDTIVEVLIVLAILSMAFGTSTGIATRSLHQSRTAEEHSQALGILNTQLEQLRSAATAGADVFQNGKSFCMTTTNTPDYGFISSYVIPASQNADDFTKYAPACKDLSTFYNQSIVYDASTGNYTIRVRWEGIGTLGRQQEITSYRVYKLTTTVSAPLATVFQCSDGGFDNDGDGKVDAADPGCHSDAVATNGASYNPSDNDEQNPACFDGIENDVPSDGKVDAADPGCHSDAVATNAGSYTPTKTNESNTACSDGIDNDGDSKIDFGADPGCANLADNNEVGSPLAATISPGSFSATAWHMLNTGGSKKSQVFTIRNPAASDASLQITTTVLSGANTNSFQIISNSCAGATLAIGAACNITVQFYPPSGPSNNRLGNAGLKTATLTVNNSNGVGPVSASLSGAAVSDRMAPGDTMLSSSETSDASLYSIRAYTPACYNNALSCSAGLDLWSDGNLALYPDVTVNYAAYMTGATGANHMVMEAGNGDLVMYRPGDIPVLDTGAKGSGAWLHIYADGSLWLMNPDWQSSNSGNTRIYP